MHVRMPACARTCVRVFVDTQAIQLLIPSNIQRCWFDAEWLNSCSFFKKVEKETKRKRNKKVRKDDEM